MKDNQYISQGAAVKRMRELSELNIPFSFGFISFNANTKTSNNYRVVKKGLLRKGYRSNQSDKSNSLIAYIDYSDSHQDKMRQFYYPLLMMFNGQIVQP